MRLTPKQAALLAEMREHYIDGCPWTEVFPSEARTARSLAARGLLALRGDGGEIHEARLTAEALALPAPQRAKSLPPAA